MTKTAILSISLVLVLVLPSSGACQDTGVHRSFRLSGISLRAALDSLMKWYAVSLVYLDSDVEGKRVTATCTDCGFDEAVQSVLNGTSLTWIRTGNQVILKEQPVKLHRQLSTVSGIVTDSLTGEWIAGANVVLRGSAEPAATIVQRWCPTNLYGFYALRRVPAGTYTIVIHALGYQTTEIPVIVAGDDPVRQDVGLRQEEIVLQEVTVEGHLKALASVEGYARGIYIRSTPSDQNHYLLDGARIYNPSHFGGVLSTFNGEVLNDVQLVVGGLPPSYGGRIGGILDLSTRDGSRERLAGSAGTGSLGSHLSIEGPLTDNTTFLLSGRRGYPDAQVPFLTTYGAPSRLGSSEVTAKLSHRLSGSDRLFLSGYIGSDSYSNLVAQNGEELSNNFSWGNGALSLRWIGLASPSLFLHASAVYTRYTFSMEHILTGDPFLPGGARLTSEYAVEDVSVRAHAEHYYDEEHTVRGGVELVSRRMRCDVSEFSTQIGGLSLQDFSSWELSVYLQDQWKILPGVSVELGARATSFTGPEGSFSGIDPRFALLVALDNQTRLYSSLTSINQFVHPYRNSGVFLFYPPIFWYPSSEGVGPSTSFQVTLGVQRALQENDLVLGAESFYRTTHKLHEFAVTGTSAVTGDLRDAILFGTGKVYGVEVSLRKRAGDLTGSMSYTLAWGTNEFAELNGGEPFAARFDRRHELQATVSYAPGADWLVGALCVLASEHAPSFERRVMGEGTDPALGERGFIDVNGSRLPGFQRLEVSLLRRFTLGRFVCQLSLRLLNAYGLLDPFLWQLRTASDLRLKWSARMQHLELFRFSRRWDSRCGSEHAARGRTPYEEIARLCCAQPVDSPLVGMSPGHG